MPVFSRNSLVVVILIVAAAVASGQQVATPTFNANGGWFVTERAVTVTTATSGATINYTTNGATPTSTDRTVASGGTILVDRPLTLKANATKTGMTPSSTASAAFTISGKVTGGQNHTIGLMSEGTVWSWGSNSVGQLSIGTADASTHSTPTQAKLNSTTLLSGISGVGAGASHSLAIKSADGSVYGWGNDSSGQLGDNSSATQQLYPVQVKTTATGNPLLVGITDVAGGASHSIALKSDGTVWTWGSNASSQLGDGGTTSRKLAAQVKTANNSFLTGVMAIAAGDNFCVAVKSDGTVWAWGVNASGQLGIGSTTTQKFAVQVKLVGGAALSGITDIACGSSHVAALKSDGTIWTWGSNTNGQLGNGTTTQANNPVQAKINSTTFIGGSYALAAGATHTLVLKTDASVWSCGLNSSGQLSINSTTQQLYFVQGSASSGVFLSGIVDIGAGGSHSLVTQSDGTVLGCGLNSSGQAGYPTTTVNPTRATAIPNFLIISAFADPDNDGIATWRERELGTNPTSSDTDGDGIPDGWEVNHNLNPLVNDASADPDGDGYTNLQEYQNNTDPYDYYNSAPFTLNIISGNNQASPTGFWVGQPLVVRTANGSGGSLTNAPVTFTLAQAGGGLSLTDHGTTASSLSLRTDTSGQATVYYLQPSSGTSGVNVQAGTGGVQQVSFTASFLNIPITGMKLWLRSDAGVTKDANNLVSLWRDQSPAGNNAAQGVTGNSPLFVANGWSGKPVIRFNGSTSSMNGAMSLSSQMSVFAVAAEGSGVGFKRLINNEGHFYLGTAPDGNFASFYGNGTWGTTQSHPFALAPNQVTMLESINNGNDSAYVNGQLVDSRANPMTAFTNGFELGRHPSGIQYWDGDILEVLIYDGALSTVDRQAIEIYLNQKYSLIVAPTSPTGITATPMSYGRIDVSWSAPAGASSYSVERKIGAGGTYATIGATSSPFFADVTVVAGSQYYYRVLASNIAGQSGYSGETIASVESLPPIPTSGIAFWLRAERGVTKDQTNHIGSWLDQSGQNLAGTQPTAAVQPLFVDDSMNGKPVVRFDGLDDVMSLPNFATGMTEGEVFIVAKESPTQVDVSTLWMIGDDSIWNPNTYPGGDGTVCETFGTRNQKCTGVPSQPLNQAHLYDVSSKTGEFVMRFNGVEHYRTTSNTVFFPSAPQLGGGVYYRHRFGGDIAELIVFNHVLSQADRDTIKSYLANKYFLPGFDFDGDGLTNGQESALGSNPNSSDTDGDQMPDGWEYAHGLDLLVDDAAADPDGDGFSNLQEYQNNTGPFDYFNGAVFNLGAASGTGQISPPGTWLPQALVAHLSNESGGPLVNAPVTFTVQNGGGALSATSGGATSSSFLTHTDGNGDAMAYYRQGTAPDTASVIVVQAGTTTIKTATFTASTADIPSDGLKLWLNAEAGVVASSGNVTSWTDQSGGGNNAFCNSGHNPAYISGAVAGRPAIGFFWNPTPWYATSMAGTLSLGSNTSVFAAASVYGYSTGSVISNDKHFYFGNEDSGNFATYYGNGTSWNNTQSHSLQLPANTFNILESINGSVENAYVNGILLDFRPNPMTPFSNGYLLGKDLNGYIAEVLVYDRSLSDAERVQVENYLNRRYNVVSAPPAAPANLTGVVTTSSQATLSWNAQPGVLFKIERKTGSNGTYSQIGATTQAGVTSFVDTSFTAGPQYFYRIRATNIVGDSDYSNWVLVSTAPDADENGLLDQWEIQYFGHIGIDPAGDADNDGFTNLQEFQLGTDPTNSTSGPTLTAGTHAQFIRQTVPGTMVAGRSYPVSITMRNSGTSEWTLPGGANPCLLGIPGLSGGDTSSWGRVTVSLPNAVPSGQLVTFNFTVTTPLDPGSYHFQWAMLQPGAQWLEQFTPDVVIAIVDPSFAPGAVTISDPLNDWSLVWSQTPGWNIAVDSSGNFEGDDSRIVRASSFLESITYQFPQILGATAAIYYRNGFDLSQLHFLTSADGTTWSPVAVDVSTSIPQAGGWSAAMVSQYQAIPAGTNYLKVEVGGTGFADLQMGEVQITHTDLSAPTVQGGTISVAPEAENTFSVDASDADGDPLSFTIVSPPAHGTLAGVGPIFTYTPESGYQGEDTFTVSVTDGLLTTDPVVINLEVQPVSIVPPSAVTVVDDLANFDLVFSQTEHWQLDTANPANFGGDLSRAVRTAASPENLIYSYQGITAFNALVYSTDPTTPDAVRLYASSDGTNWTRLCFAQQPPAQLASGWWVSSIDASAALPSGTNFVRIELRGADASTPEIGRVTLTYTGADTDANGLADQWEIDHFGAIGVDPNADPDGDGLTNLQEYRLGTNPLADNDSDGDGMPDSWELRFGLNPAVNDAAGDLDGDGVDNLTEFLQGRDPTKGTVDGAAVINLQVFTPLQ